jgi:hypothetical protein
VLAGSLLSPAAGQYEFVTGIDLSVLLKRADYVHPRMRNSRTKSGTGIPNAHNKTQPTFPVWLRSNFIDLSILPRS